MSRGVENCNAIYPRWPSSESRGYSRNRKADACRTLVSRMNPARMHELKTEEANFPAYSLFRAVCSSGLSKVRPLRQVQNVKDQWGWNFGRGWPPSYWAYGRMRAMMTMLEATSLKPGSVLEVAAGDASLSACLELNGCHVVANDLRGEDLERAIGYFANAKNIQ